MRKSAPCRRRRAGRDRPLRLEALEPRTLLAGDITTGLVHYWTFDETSGDTAHDTVGGSDGILLNWNATEPKWEPGRVGGALHFSTADDAVVATPPAMSGSYAVSFWLNVTDRSGTNPRIFQSRAGNEIVVNNDSSRSVGYYYVGNSTVTADPSVPTFNTWEHYAINFNAAGQGVVYHNGAPVAVGGFVDSASLALWAFGHSSDLANTTDSLNGLLDDLRVYNRRLTDDDIALLASQGTPEPTHQAPVHRWTFDETSGNTAHDVAGGADGILLNWGAAEPKWVPGKIGGALAFSTTDDAVVTAPTYLHSKWSVAFWVEVTAHGGTNPRIIGPQDGRELWAYLDLENNGGGAFMSHNIRTFETTAIPFNSWQHYAINYDTDSDVATIYHNGVQVASGVFHDNATLQAWVFGHNCDLANHTDSLNGLLDDLRVYDRLLSAAEIQRLASDQAAIASGDAYTTKEDTPLNVPAASGVLSNDSDLDDNAPKALLDTGAQHGDVTLAEDGSFTYKPLADYNGSDSFTYRLKDSQGNNVGGSVSLNVTPVNDAPSFVSGADRFVDDESGDRQITHWASLVKAGPPDESGQSLTFTAVADKPELLLVQPKIEVVDGQWGKLTYTVARNKVGVVTVTVTLKDDGGTADGGVDTSQPQTFKITIRKAHPWYNAVLPLDVTGDGRIVALDAMTIINFLNANGAGAVDPTGGASAPYCDVNADGGITAGDAFAVIAFLNANLPGSATFVGVDTTTQGNWLGHYGAEGYDLNSGAASLPDYASVSFSGEYDVTWAATTSDVRALQTPDAANRFAAAWTGHNSSSIPLNGFVIDLNLNTAPKRVAVYVLDWDTTSRTEQIDVLDGNTGRVLDTQLSGPFHDGKYFIWNLSGHIQIRFTNLANGLNAVASGIFFG